MPRRKCIECNRLKSTADFRYPNQQKNYAKRCSLCRNKPLRLKCHRCKELKPPAAFRRLAKGGYSRTCMECFGSEGNHISASVKAAHQMMDAAGIPNCNWSLEDRVAMLIANERRAISLLEPLLKERYENRRKQIR